MMQLSLTLTAPREHLALAPGAYVLRGFALPIATELFDGVERVCREAPFRHLMTPGGKRMSVAMTNCGALGWFSDASGYRYTRVDPQSEQPWPTMPEAFQRLARAASSAAGFTPIAPHACLINRYVPGARLTLHQDKDEQDLEAPIVSVSMGLAATFLFGGATRHEAPRRIRVEHGDVVVWGGPSRLRYHGLAALPEGFHPATGYCRINLSFRVCDHAGHRTQR